MDLRASIKNGIPKDVLGSIPIPRECQEDVENLFGGY